ncbi:MAG: ABC transporter ATP-binding protein, partial [Mycobacterium sp.]
GDRGRAGELLALMGLAERTRNFPGQLSGGQQQRVAIARALIADPDLLLADEPMGALDVTTGQRVLGLLQQANRSDGRGVIMVTHNKVAAEVADRVVHMRDGVIVDDRRNQNPAEAADVRW